MVIVRPAPALALDDFGRARSPDGGSFLQQCLDLPASPVGDGLLRRDPQGRWAVGGTTWRASVSHSGGWLAAALYDGGHVGVDVQARERRPAAARWLGSVAQAGSTGDLAQQWSIAEALCKARGDAARRPSTLPVLTGDGPGWQPVGTQWWSMTVDVNSKVVLSVVAPSPVDPEWL